VIANIQSNFLINNLGVDDFDGCGVGQGTSSLIENFDCIWVIDSKSLATGIVGTCRDNPSASSGFLAITNVVKFVLGEGVAG
jgi:hypothetical protein